MADDLATKRRFSSRPRNRTSAGSCRVPADRFAETTRHLRERVESPAAGARRRRRVFSNRPASRRRPAPTIDHTHREKPGTQIGPYKLLQQIGEGGLGVVYMAEQTEPVKRRVALKIIKPGMDTQQVIARFEAEEQALAMMDHPNIAKVFDAGATDSGRPYFVMELVKEFRSPSTATSIT